MNLASIRLLALAVASLSPIAARAELGGALTSVAGDRARLGAQLRSVAAGRYTRHELTRPNGGMVREFTNANGQVFAVTWNGPGKPDLRSVLGRYFATFQNSAAGGGDGRRTLGLRRPMQVDAADLQIVSGGHMGWFHGVAYVPSLAPAGFAAGDLPQP